MIGLKHVLAYPDMKLPESILKTGIAKRDSSCGHREEGSIQFVSTAFATSQPTCGRKIKRGDLILISPLGVKTCFMCSRKLMNDTNERKLFSKDQQDLEFLNVKKMFEDYWEENKERFVAEEL